MIRGTGDRSWGAGREDVIWQTGVKDGIALLVRDEDVRRRAGLTVGQVLHEVLEYLPA